ncbi:MAG: hypothetical protein LAO03_04590 [Acidobacteriia bacterium]|nr:hypothetical protein [Terriglobia bacterium]
MNSAPSPQIGQTRQVTPTAPPTSADVQRYHRTREGLAGSADAAPRRVGYGLPCAKCRTYFAADLTTCPVCKSSERVSPTAVSLPSNAVLSETSPDPDALEVERERFLREFKSQVYASHTQINAAAAFRCSLEANHPEDFEPAAVCKGCFDHAQERVDVLEAALHMDVKEAAQVIYDAVWSDPSDPSKTYQNAAQAILAELRKRAGIALVLGPLQPLSH